MQTKKNAFHRYSLFAGAFVLTLWLPGSEYTAEAQPPGEPDADSESIVEAQSGEPDLEFTAALSTAFKNANPSVKRRIISILNDIGEPAVPILTDALDDPSAGVRRDAAIVLGNIGKSAQSAIPHLFERLSDSSKIVREKAVTAIGQIGDGQEAADRLVPLLRDSSSTIRKETARALGRIKIFSPQIATALITGLGDARGDIREKANELWHDWGLLLSPT